MIQDNNNSWSSSQRKEIQVEENPLWEAGMAGGEIRMKKNCRKNISGEISFMESAWKYQEEKEDVDFLILRLTSLSYS